MDGIKLKPSDVCKSWSITTASSFAFSTIASCFLQLLKHDTDMLASNHIILYLQHCYASIVTSNAVHDYWKMLHKCCNTDMVGVLLIYPHSLLGAACPRDCTYISVKPLTAVLQPINACMYICMSGDDLRMHEQTYVHMYIHTHLLLWVSTELIVKLHIIHVRMYVNTHMHVLLCNTDCRYNI